MSKTTMWIGTVCLFPEMFAALNYGITGRAIHKGLLTLKFWNPKNFAHDRHHSVDDRPYGGGPGMVMMVQPLRDAIQAARQAAGSKTCVIQLSPQGERLTQTAVDKLATQNKLIFVTGRYEGIDERLIATEVDQQWSLGDYVISGGELAAMIIIDAITRLLPGALGDEDSAKQDSFVAGLLDYPHYTRPEVIEGLKVPQVLLSGNHQAIQRWRMKQALGRTWQRRPDLLDLLKKQHKLTEQQQILLDEFIKEYKENQR